MSLHVDGNSAYLSSWAHMFSFSQLYDHLLIHSLDLSSPPITSSISSSKHSMSPLKSTKHDDEEEHKEKEDPVTTDDETDAIIKAMHKSLDEEEEVKPRNGSVTSVKSDKSDKSEKHKSEKEKEKERATSPKPSDKPTDTSSPASPTHSPRDAKIGEKFSVTVTHELKDASIAAQSERIDLSDVTLKRTASLSACRDEDLDATLADLEREEKHLQSMLEEEKKAAQAALDEMTGMTPSGQSSPVSRIRSISVTHEPTTTTSTTATSTTSPSSTSKNQKKNKKKK